MTFKQAYTQWAAIPVNTVRAAKYRQATLQVLIKNYGEEDLDAFTKDRVVMILKPHSKNREYCIRSLSILVDVLKWAAEKGECDMPDYGMSLASASMEMPVTKYEAQVIADDKVEVQLKPVEQGDPIVQVDPDSGNIITWFPSASAAAKAMGFDSKEEAAKIRYAVAHQNVKHNFLWFSAALKPGDIKKIVENINNGTYKKRKDRKKATVKAKPQPKLETVKSESTPERVFVSDITQFSDEELVVELRRRGWKGDISLVITKTLHV